MKIKTIEQIPEYKKKIVNELVKLIKENKTILIASIKNLPASQFQKIGKKLRGKAVVKVPKKSLILRAIDESQNEELKKLSKYIDDSTAILFSNLDSYELASELLKNKSPAKAKPGQEAPEDIEIEAGPTDLPPGPAISELGSVGLQVQIENGKITIREPRVIVKAGKKITQNVADVMNKLDIKPFSIGFIPLSAFDIKENKLYLEIKIDTKQTLEELKLAFGKSLALAIEISYVCEDTVKIMVAKAGSHEKALEKLFGGEDKVVNKKTEDDNADIDKSNNQREQLTDDKNSEPQNEVKEENQTQSDKPDGEEK